MRSTQLCFARTLRAVDALHTASNQDAHFPRFSSLPPEIRTAIWRLILPGPDDESPAIFSQTHSWRDDDGLLGEPSGFVPIRMTTTCAALLHVNRESRDTALSWAAIHGYSLLYRRLCPYPSWDDQSDTDTEAEADQDDDTQDREKYLPVQGPIFVRPWDPSKDIMHVSDEAFGGVESSWDDNYRDGEELTGVQHIAFNSSCIDNYLRSRWFYQLLAAMPDLKSVSLDFICLIERDGEPFAQRYLETERLDDTQAARNASTRWEPNELAPEDTDAWEELESFENRVMQGYLGGEYWPPEDEADDDSEGGKDRSDILERLPPWIRDPKEGGIAFKVRGYDPVERRGYDDVRGGLVAQIHKIYPVN